MAGDLEILAKVFGDKELIAGLDAFHRQVRMRTFGAMKSLGRAFAQDVATSGLAEQGIKSRTGLLRGSFVVRGRLSAASASVLIYPNATDPRRKYRYPWALGKGSPKNETTVRAHVRGRVAGSRSPTASTYNRRKRRLYSDRATAAHVASGAVRVTSHIRKVNMRPRPFMSGGALTRLQSDFGRRIEEAVAAAIREAQAVTSGGDFEGAGVS